MTKFSRRELEDTFTLFRSTLAKAMRTKDWTDWSHFFTEDALYIEHAMGTFHGRAEILDWVVRTMSMPLIDNIESFPVGWYMIDEERGWIVAQFISRMRDVGDGKIHETYCFTLLKYAGNGQWNYEEDIYNPMLMQDMLEQWESARVKFDT